MNLHGTRSVQKVIEVCRGTPSQVAMVVAALRDATVPLCLDTNGNHVVQRLLQHLAPADNAFVFEVSFFFFFNQIIGNTHAHPRVQYLAK